MHSLTKNSNTFWSAVPALCVLGLLSACQSENGQSNTYSGDMVLAMSWQPGFCETRSRLRECRSQKAGRFDVTHFSLHGLWPQPGSNIYCGVDQAKVQMDKKRRWKQLGGLGLSKQTQQRLFEVMPGSRSFLHRHEWIKHGTCYSQTPETYYIDSLALMDAINGSSVQTFFESSIGRRVTSQQIRKAFDRAFGDGVGKRVRVACKRDGRRMIITEVTLGLSGKINREPNIGRLALASPTTRSGCPIGEVDRVGLQ